MLKRSLTTRKRWSLSLILLSIVGLTGFLLKKKKKRLGRSEARILTDALKNSGYERMRSLILAQAQVESANFTSNLFTRQNNAFGMKNASRRVQLGHKVYSSDFRGYNSLTESVEDLLLWMKFTQFPLSTTPEIYVSNLKKRHYFEDTQDNYLKALNSWL